MSSANGRLTVAADPSSSEAVSSPAPLWFRIAVVSVAVFAGPAAFALVVGLLALLAWLCGAMVGLVRHGAGL